MSTSTKINPSQAGSDRGALRGPVVVFQWSVKKGWPVEYVSGNVEEVLGYAPEQFLSGDLLYNDVIHPDDRDRVERECNRYLDTGASHGIHFHYRVERADGELIYVDEATSIVRDEHGDATCLVGHVIDVSQRRHSEEVLRHEHSWLESLIQAMPDGVSFRDGQGRWLLANDFTLDYLGLQGVDYQGKTAEELAEISDNYRVAKWDCRRTDDQAWERGEPFSFEQQVSAPDGELRTFDVVKVPVYEADGSRKGLLVVARDITERKHTEDALEESRARLAEAQRFAQLGSWQFDLDTHTLELSDQTFRIFGLDPDDEAVDLDMARDCVPEAEIERIERALERTQQTGEPFQVEHRLVRLDGAERIVNSQGKIEQANHSRRLVGIIQDITDRKRVERLKEEFVSIVSHELRTPLTPITGVLTLLSGGAGGQLPARLEKMVELAQRNSHRLLYLIDDLLDIQQMSTGQMNFHIRELDLGKVVRESLRINVGMEHQDGVKFAFDDSATDISVKADKGRLIQVMTNLLSNAAKFSPPNSVVHIRLERSGDNTARVSVFDKGPGISEAFRGRVFDKFAQEDSSSTRKHGGTGLGLTIAKSIVERLGGEIGVDTEVEQGSTFYFELPTC